MSKSSGNTTTDSTTGPATGGGGAPTPHPKRVIDFVLLIAILSFVIYDTYLLSKQTKLLQELQVMR